MKEENIVKTSQFMICKPVILLASVSDRYKCQFVSSTFVDIEVHSKFTLPVVAMF